MNKVIDKGFRSCRFVSTIVKHPVNIHCMQWRNQRFEPGGQSLVEGGPLVTVEGPPVNNQKNANTQKKTTLYDRAVGGLPCCCLWII